MPRYAQTPIVRPVTQISTVDQKLRYINVKYPTITLDPQDVYVYTVQGDRYDVMALTFYKDPDLWWIINRANPNQDSASLFPTVGSQIRIPSLGSHTRIHLVCQSYIIYIRKKSLEPNIICVFVLQMHSKTTKCCLTTLVNFSLWPTSYLHRTIVEILNDLILI